MLPITTENNFDSSIHLWKQTTVFIGMHLMQNPADLKHLFDIKMSIACIYKVILNAVKQLDYLSCYTYTD